MSASPVGFEEAAIDALMAHAGRATLPYQPAHRGEGHATAFWFNELVRTDADGETVRPYLVTAAEPTRVDLAEVTLRPELCDPAPSASKVVMTDFAQGWTVLPGLGVAVLPTAALEAYAERKGWRWSTDEITDGLAARAEDTARIGQDPVTAYVLGHEADDERRQAVVVGALARAADGSVRWGGRLPEGCVGAPAFMGLPLKGNAFKLVCVGVALPADDHGFGHHPVATFDAIRTALAPAADRPARRWWPRRR